MIFPDGIKITGSPTWDGTINLPTFQPSSLVEVESDTITAVIEVGAGDEPLTFDKPVQIKFENKGDHNAFFTRNGVTTEVTTICSGNTLSDNLGLPENGDCKITVGDDLYVWTMHFTLASVGSPNPSPSPSNSSSGGSSGDRTPPSFTTTFDETEFPFSINGKQYRLNELNAISSITIETGKPLHLQLKMYENGGVDNVQHVTLYLNQDGNRILNDLTETTITFEQGKETEISDPYNLIESVTIKQSTDGNKSVFDFEVIFSNEMGTSDLLFRVWDAKRNSVNLHIPDTLMVIIGEPTSTFSTGVIKEDSIPTSNESIDEEPIFSWQKFDQWAGYADSTVSDIEFLENVGIDGDSIPSWVKQNNAKWVKEGKLTQQELVIALENLKSRGII
jgi:hypothetical protein